MGGPWPDFLPGSATEYGCTEHLLHIRQNSEPNSYLAASYAYLSYCYAYLTATALPYLTAIALPHDHTSEKECSQRFFLGGISGVPLILDVFYAFLGLHKS